jgi:hypothetical protein
VRRVESVSIPVSNERKFKPGEIRREIIVPDLQIGYRKYEDGSVDPFHDEKAIDVALQLIREIQPSRIVLVGDLLDLPTFGKYMQSPEFAHTTNMSIQYAHNFLKTIRELSPESKVVLLEGNHDRRIENALKTNMMAAYGIRRANETLPVMSVPYLLALDQLGIDYVGGYPAGRYFITPTLQVIHGTATGKSLSSQVVGNEGVSTIQGHAHKWSSMAKTTRTYDGARQTFAFSLGTLSRIDGAVLGVKGSTGVDGRPIESYEDWQQMIGVISHDGKAWSMSPVFIDTMNNYKTFFENKVYEPARRRKR